MTESSGFRPQPRETTAHISLPRGKSLAPSSEPQGITSLGSSSTVDRRATSPSGRRVAGFLAAGVLVTSCGGPSPDQDATPTHQAPAIIRIDTVLPPELPQAVQAQVGSAVDIGSEIPLEESRFPDGTLALSTSRVSSLGSGVRISETEVATAGHVRAEHPEAACGDFTIKTRVEDSIRKAPVTAEAHSYLSDNVSADSYDVPDFGIMEVEPRLLEGVPIAQVRQTPLEVGEPVYFVNYQPTADGTDREPSASDPYSQPAEYGGIVASTDGQLSRVITDIGASYGDVYDDVTRAGASGGAVFDAQGQLVAIVSRGLESGLLGQNQAFGVELSAYPDVTVSEAKVTPVTQTLIDQLRAEIDASPSCPSTEPIVTVYGQ